jgi:predicted NAD/FAD-binding protein
MPGRPGVRMRRRAAAPEPRMNRQRIAIVGGGGAGLATAWLLQRDHEVTLFEKESHLGGHAHTFDVPIAGDVVCAETGFKYVLDGSHQTLLALMKLLGLEPQRRKSSLTIVDRVHDRVLVLPPRSPVHLARVLRQLPLVRALRRMMAAADWVVARRDWSRTLAQEAAELGLSDRFTRELLLPLCASSWGTTVEQMRAFPAYDVMKNLWKGAAGFYELPGGVSAYVRALTGALTARIERGRTVRRIETGDGLLVDGERFDQVVMATPAWVAADLLATLPVGAVLREFRWFDTRIFIHGDASFMPARRGDWSVVNHLFDGQSVAMTEWSGHQRQHPVFRSWVPRGAREPGTVHTRRDFQHLVVTTGTELLQRSLEAHQGATGVWLAGMYVTDVDDHESALLSAIRIATALAPQSPNLRQLRAAMPPGAGPG